MAQKYDRYSAKGVKGEFAESKTKKTPYISVIYEVIDGEHKGKQFEFQGYLSDATAERTAQSLRYSGCTFPNDDITNLAGLGSKDVEIQVEQTDFGPRVAWVNEPRVSSVTDENKLSGAAKKNLATNYRSILVGLKGGKAATKAAAPVIVGDPFAVETPAENTNEGEQRATGTDDQIPF